MGHTRRKPRKGKKKSRKMGNAKRLCMAVKIVNGSTAATWAKVPKHIKALYRKAKNKNLGNCKLKKRGNKRVKKTKKRSYW